MSQHYLTWAEPASRAILQKILEQGKLAITSSDTVLGFLASLTEEGFRKLDNLKQRANKPYLVLMGDISTLNYFIDQPLSSGLERMLVSCWPGPVTIIFKARVSLPTYMKGPDGTIALRVPKHEGLLELLKHFPGLFSTSANLHGKPIPETIDDIDPKILEAVECVVIDDIVTNTVKVPSTILDCTGEQIRVVREGAYPLRHLEALYGASFLKPLTTR
jgi:L-threonylcarbamoyladenylate synthase